MADDIENQLAPIPLMAPPLPEAKQDKHPVVTEIIENPSDQVMVDSNETDMLTENHSVETGRNTEDNGVPPVEKRPEPIPEADNAQESGGDVDMSDHNEYSDEESEYEPEDSPPPKSRRSPTRTPKTPQSTRPPKTPTSRVRSGRVEKSSSPASQGNLRCPVKGCGQTFTGRNPRQSLWHHLKYYATRGLPDRQDFEKLHGEAHSEMKREAEPKGTPVERNRISSSDYRKKNPEKAKTSARLSNFRARARKKGLNSEQEVEDAVLRWEKEWQEKQAKEASEYFSGILLSAFE